MPANQYPDIAFGPAALSRQEAVGVNRPRESGDFELESTDVAQIRRADHFFLSTVTETGWPYMQHKGGPAGFVHVPARNRLAWADLPGNRQYVSTGNVDADGRVCLFFIDYPTRSRLKVFGHARVIEAADAPELVEELRRMGDKHYSGQVERVFVVDVVAADANCSKHIKPRWDREYVDELTGIYREQIEALREQS